MAHNYITGTIDLTQLPDQTAWFDVRDNGISGSINLTRLPAGIRVLVLSVNPIHQKVVYYGTVEGRCDINLARCHIDRVVPLQQGEEGRMVTVK